MNIKNFINKYAFLLKETFFPTILVLFSISCFYFGYELIIVSFLLLIIYTIISPLYSIKIKNRLLFNKIIISPNYYFESIKIQIYKLFIYLFITLTFALISFIIGASYYHTDWAQIFIGIMISLCGISLILAYTLMSQSLNYLIYDMLENNRLKPASGYIYKSASFTFNRNITDRFLANTFLIAFMILMIFCIKWFAFLFIPFFLNYKSNTNLFKFIK